MNVKRELIFGVIGGIIVIAMSLFYARSYQQIRLQIPTAPVPSQTQPADLTQPNHTILLTNEEIATHATPSDCWVIVNSSAYAVTSYLTLHPGGAGRIIPYCGKDATAAFATKGGEGTHSKQADQDLAMYKLGDINQTVSAASVSQTSNATISATIQPRTKREEKEEEYDD